MIEGRALSFQAAELRLDRAGHSQALGPTVGIAAEALEAARIGTWRMDTLTGLGSCDGVTCEIMGLHQTSVVDERDIMPIHPDDRPMVMESLNRSFTTGALHDVEYRVPGLNGRWRWVRSVARPSGGAPGTRYITGVVTDVTDRRSAEAKLSESRQQLATLLNALPGVAYRCSAHTPRPLTFISEAVEELTGYAASDFLDNHLPWSNIMHPEDVARWDENIVTALAEFRRFTGVYRIIHRSGDVRWVQGSGEATYGSRGNPVSIEGYIQDVTAERAVRDKLRWNATHDVLTGLPNRAFFQAKLDQAIVEAKSHCTGFAVLLLDVDDFKTVNDTLGHDAGDALLCTFAKRLEQMVEPGDTIARLGGDEFAIILKSGTTKEVAKTTADAMASRLCPTSMHKGAPADCCASIGVSLYPDHGSCRIELMKHADLALYEAKAAGRATAVIFHADLRAALQTRVSMLNVAREVLQQDQIVPFYQPKVDLRTGRLLGLEALLRWTDPRGQIQGPSLIAAAFEDADLANAISERMIEKALADGGRWTRDGLSFGHIAINAAAAEFTRGDFAESLIERVERAGLRAEQIKIEVTESVFLGRGAEHVGSALRILREHGIRIALDDFGTGFASLAHLKKIPVDELKIDRSFVTDLDRHPESAAIIRALVALGDGLRLEIVAEGVETLAELKELQELGCGGAQGFLFGKAESAASVPDLDRRAGEWKKLLACGMS